MRTVVILIGMAWAGSALALPPTIWDLEWAQTAPLDVQDRSITTVQEEGVPIEYQEFTYFSHEWQEKPIRIGAALAVPAEAKRPLPALLLVTSGGADARRYAARQGIVALAIDRVGEGRSTGPRDVYENWFDLGPDLDVRNSWMYHYVYSAIRAVTLLRSLPEVDDQPIGISGVSRGGICSLLTAAVDPRIALSLPIAATGDFARTVQMENNWLLRLLLEPLDLTPQSPEWNRFIAQFDPLHWKEAFHGLVWIIDGAQDEFFPITSVAAMLSGQENWPTRRVTVLYDADHGYYGSDSGLFDTYNNSKALWHRIFSNIAKGVRTVLKGEGTLPDTPALEVELQGEKLIARAQIDTAEPVHAVQLIVSDDGAYTFRRTPMERTPAGSWTGSIDVSGSSWVAFVEVEYRDAEGPYFLTSVPVFSERFAPRIRPPVFP